MAGAPFVLRGHHGGAMGDLAAGVTRPLGTVLRPSDAAASRSHARHLFTAEQLAVLADTPPDSGVTTTTAAAPQDTPVHAAVPSTASTVAAHSSSAAPRTATRSSSGASGSSAPSHPTTTTTRPTPPTTAAPRHSQSGPASWYDAPAGSCAHPSLPMGTVLRVTNLATGASTTCTVSDRGPYEGGRIIDLARATFSQIASTSQGVIQVRIEW